LRKTLSLGDPRVQYGQTFSTAALYLHAKCTSMRRRKQRSCGIIYHLFANCPESDISIFTEPSFVDSINVELLCRQLQSRYSGRANSFQQYQYCV